MTFAKDNKIGEWSILKLKFLESYLTGYLNATKRARQKYYIDCFAGKIQYVSKETGESIKGSTELVLNLNKSFDAYYFIELDSQRINELNKLKEKYPEKNINVIQDDCNKVLKKILPNIHPDAPTFIFFDTDGINIEWETLVFASNWHTEFLINFPFYMSIKRNIPWNEKKLSNSKIEKITKFFGTDEWKNIHYDKTIPKSRKNYLIIDLYKKNIEKLGFKYVMFSDTFNNSIGAKLYFLVFASNHPAGEKIMKHVFRKQFNPQLSFLDDF